MKVKQIYPSYLLLLAIFLFCLVIPDVTTARVICPRLTCDHIADTTDLKRFRQFHEWKDKNGNELALAIWKYLSDYETGLYHFNEILEGPDESRRGYWLIDAGRGSGQNEAR